MNSDIRFESLYARYAQDVFRFALYLTGNHAQAEDITSETFVRAWSSSQKIRTGSVKSYLLTIAHNLHRDALRKSWRRTELDDQTPDPGPNPEQIAGDRSELSLVLESLQKLPAVDRAAILMRAQEGMSHESIAAALGLSIVAVKVRIHRARLKLKTIMNETKATL